MRHGFLHTHHGFLHTAQDSSHFQSWEQRPFPSKGQAQPITFTFRVIDANFKLPLEKNNAAINNSVLIPATGDIVNGVLLGVLSSAVQKIDVEGVTSFANLLAKTGTLEPAHVATLQIFACLFAYRFAEPIFRD